MNDIEKEIERIGRSVCKNAAGLIRDELTETARESIERFYADYEPSYYHRHYVNFRKKSFRKYYSNPHNRVFTGGVELTPELLDDYYREDATVVFDSVYAGFHGPVGYDVSPSKNQKTPKRMYPSPMDIVLFKRDKIIHNIDKYINKAQTMVLKEV